MRKTNMVLTPEQEEKEKQKKRKTVKIVLIVIVAFVLYNLIQGTVFFAIFWFMTADSKVTHFDSPSDYEKIFVDKWKESNEEYQITHDAPFDIIPVTISGEITELSYTYYDPWDAQKLIAVRIQYSDEDYQNELTRLQQYGKTDFAGIYSVTGEAPEGYDFVAMKADSYSGFAYALTPETSDHSITYVVIDFCNYFLDIDIHEYFPEQYLLPGFDASENDAYEQSMGF